MGVPKKKKLESAINNLFSSPRSKTVKNQETEPAQTFAESASIPEDMEVGTGMVSQSAETVEAVAVVVEHLPVTAEIRVEEKKPEAALPVAEPVIPAAKMEPAAPQRSLPVEGAPEVGLPEADSAASVGQESIQMVIFTLDGQFYGIDIASVESIIKMQSITRLPHVPAYTIGLTNLRGKVIPVFSLRRRFGLPDLEENKANRIIIIRLEQEEVGLMVDGVSEVETILRENIEPAPSMALTVSTQFINGIAKLGERLVIFLNVNKVISSAA